MTRKVSKKNRGKKKKKKKSKRGAAGQIQHPFCIPFASPTMNGCKEAKPGSGKIMNNGKVHLAARGNVAFVPGTTAHQRTAPYNLT